MMGFKKRVAIFFILSVGTFPVVLWADGGVRFQDIAALAETGIDYHRTRSARDAIWQAIKEKEAMTIPDDLLAMPVKSRGMPAIALFDYDGDGDLDIYVSNGPGQSNSLFANQLMETGETVFIDMAETAGVAATEQDSSGVCFGDIDNDGDHDLYVLGAGEPNILFRNNGDGSFTDITEHAGVGGGNAWSNAPAMGDVNGDGLLDIYVGNTGDMTDYTIIGVEHFVANEHNDLYLNMGNNQFMDISEASGIRNLAGFLEEYAGSAGVTWAVAMVDIDLDGDVDIINADDQATFVEKERGGIDRGIIHIFRNDGTGTFQDVAVEAGTNLAGAYMGLSFGDFNSDGHLDFFASNLGTYNGQDVTDVNLRVNASRWWMGSADGSFTRPPIDNVNGTPFGWGTSAVDYDNDGDTDIIFYGGLDVGSIIFLTNPGAVLQNDGNAVFTYDAEALADSTDHTRRVVHGMAAGDLDRNGFVDFVTASNFNIPEDVPLETFEPQGAAFDGLTKYIQPIVQGEEFGSQRYDPSLPDFLDGTLAIEMNDGANGNGWVAFRPLGAVGLTADGRVNRDGIGAVLIFTPEGGLPVMQPVLGGSSYASQDALANGFGLGTATRGSLEILWPGGVRNRLFDVHAGERLVIPEIPVSYDDPDIAFFQYLQKVNRALKDMLQAGLIGESEYARLRSSAVKAFIQQRY